LLLEHQRDPYKFSIHQLGRYTSYLEEQHERAVIPIVYFPYASAKNKTVKRETKSVFMGKRYHFFTYEALFIKGLPAKKYLKSDNIIARLMLPFMRYSKEDWLEVLDSGIKGVLNLVDPTQGLRRNKYLDFLLYYFNLEEKEWEVYRAHKMKKKEVKEVDMISTLLKEQGRLEGEVKANREMLLLLLPKRLGPMPPEIEGSILALTDLDRIRSILAQFMEINDWQELKQLLNGSN
jgi:hypothetical protein